MAAVFLSISSPPAWAQSQAPTYNARWHGALAAAAVIGAELVSASDWGGSQTCRWCGVDSASRPAVPGVDRWAHRVLRWDNPDRAARLSHGAVTLAYALPVIGLVAVDRGASGTYWRDVLVVANSYALTQFATDVAKRTLRRSRPPVVFDRQPIEGAGDVHSYFSGHTSTAFAAVVSGATIAARRGSRHARWIAWTGVGLAGAAGYLRIAANRHYLTDVLTGAAVGSAIGLAVPRLFDDGRRGPAAAPMTTAPLRALGPAAEVGPRWARARLQIGAAGGGVGVVGALRLP